MSNKQYNEILAERIADQLKSGHSLCISDMTELYGQDISDRVCKLLRERGLDVYDGIVMTLAEIRNIRR